MNCANCGDDLAGIKAPKWPPRKYCNSKCMREGLKPKIEVVLYGCRECKQSSTDKRNIVHDKECKLALHPYQK